MSHDAFSSGFADLTLEDQLTMLSPEEILAAIVMQEVGVRVFAKTWNEMNAGERGLVIGNILEGMEIEHNYFHATLNDIIHATRPHSGRPRETYDRKVMERTNSLQKFWLLVNPEYIPGSFMNAWPSELRGSTSKDNIDQFTVPEMIKGFRTLNLEGKVAAEAIHDSAVQTPFKDFAEYLARDPINMQAQVYPNLIDDKHTFDRPSGEPIIIISRDKLLSEALAKAARHFYRAYEPWRKKNPKADITPENAEELFKEAIIRDMVAATMIFSGTYAGQNNSIDKIFNTLLHPDSARRIPQYTRVKDGYHIGTLPRFLINFSLPERNSQCELVLTTWKDYLDAELGETRRQFYRVSRDTKDFDQHTGEQVIIREYEARIQHYRTLFAGIPTLHPHQ